MLPSPTSNTHHNATKIHEAAPSSWRENIWGWKASCVGLSSGLTKDQSGREANNTAACPQATPLRRNSKLNPKLISLKTREGFFLLGQTFPFQPNVSGPTQSHTTRQLILTSAESVSAAPSHQRWPVPRCHIPQPERSSPSVGAP